jgi:rare lipoprotein A
VRKVAAVLLLGLLVAGCADKPVKPTLAPQTPARADPAPTPVAAPGVQPACLQVREHRDEDYTAGGLYAPGVRDSAPEHSLDLSGIAEPVPRAEPASRYGNRSPYTVLGKTYRVMPDAKGYVERGIASWYGQKFHGRHTSSREIYDMCSFSAAHKTLPLPSFVRVTNLDNGRSAVVRVNDRGPFHAGRIIDLSYAAAVKLGVDRTGTANVEVRALTGGPAMDSDQAVPAAALSPAAAAAASGSPQLVQVGAYGEREKARQIADQLQAAGLRDVEVDGVRVGLNMLWRVRIGPVPAEALQEVLDRVHALGFTSPRVFSK